MWKLYDTLIEAIPSDIRIKDVVLGGWTAVLTDFSCGIGSQNLTFSSTSYITELKRFSNAKLQDAAELIRSFNLLEASIGQAAINAWHNSPENALSYGIQLANNSEMAGRLSDPFIACQNIVRNKKTVIVGHFHFIEQLLKPVCDLSIINNNPVYGDFPPQAAEYLLPETDFLITSSLAFTDKSLVHFLELCPNAHIIMVGPATTISPLLFDSGIDDMSGFIVLEYEEGFRVAAGEIMKPIYKTGQKVSLRKKEGMYV